VSFTGQAHLISHDRFLAARIANYSRAERPFGSVRLWDSTPEMPERDPARSFGPIGHSSRMKTGPLARKPLPGSPSVRAARGSLILLASFPTRRGIFPRCNYAGRQGNEERDRERERERERGANSLAQSRSDVTLATMRGYASSLTRLSRLGNANELKVRIYETK